MRKVELTEKQIIDILEEYDEEKFNLSPLSVYGYAHYVMRKYNGYVQENVKEIPSNFEEYGKLLRKFEDKIVAEMMQNNSDENKEKVGE